MTPRQTNRLKRLLRRERLALMPNPMRVAPMKIALVSIAFAAVVAAQGVTPRNKPSDYPAQAALDRNITIAAENLLHSLPTAQGPIVANDYLVIEVGVFGPLKQRVNLLAGKFALQITAGKKDSGTFAPDPPVLVAASITQTDLRQRPATTVYGGIGDAGGTIGTAPNTPRFPGDPSVGRPLPNPVPETPDPTGRDREPQVPLDQRIEAASLQPGDHVPPFAGLLFFPFRGKTKSIKSLDLIYDGPMGRVTLKLQ